MILYYIDNYKDVFPDFEGRELTDALIMHCLENSGYVGCDIIRTEKGKPVIRVKDGQKKVHVSVSHSGDTFACVISDSNVGLDIQNHRKSKVRKIAERWFTDREKEMVNENPEDFYMIWTRKEAYSKHEGEGLPLVIGRTDVLGRDDVTFSDMHYCSRSGEDFNVSICFSRNKNNAEIRQVIL